jgi:hypothetical protein
MVLAIMAMIVFQAAALHARAEETHPPAKESPAKEPPARKETDSLPTLFGAGQPDILAAVLKEQAALGSKLQQLPVTLEEWEKHRALLVREILEKAAIHIDHQLPLDYRETGSVQLKGYSIKNCLFQTRPGVYATANLYVPDGKGPFPAVINMHGHWPGGRMGDMVQACGHALALHGYVCLNIDAWGAGERTTVPGIPEYHGANLGASLMNVGETLMGDQVSDNIRGVDLLCSLPYVDASKIGATGASGGGNQTMWLSALDERIKAAMPVVSVGTFESYIMNSNCVCELLPDGLTFTEEAGVLGLIAPRSLKICNALQDASPTFRPDEMLRSYHNAAAVFGLYGKADNLTCQLFNTGHGYWPEMRAAMLGWFDMRLKGMGDGSPVKEDPFQLLPERKLMVFPSGERDTLVVGTAAYCRKRGRELEERLLGLKTIDTLQKRKELKTLLRLPGESAAIKAVHVYSGERGWQRMALETSGHHLIPLLYYGPPGRTKPGVSSPVGAPYVLLCSPGGKSSIPTAVLDGYIRRGYGIILADVWGTGENSSASAVKTDGSLPPFHTLARSELWLGKTVMGEWISDLGIVTQYIRTHYRPASLTTDACRETGLAALFLSALGGDADTVILRSSPVSYVFDERAGIDYFDMAIHIPGLLPWGDVSLVAALSGRSLIFINPVTMSGRPVTGRQLTACKSAFSRMGMLCKSGAAAVFE